MKYKVIEDDEVFDTIDEAIDYCIDDEYHDTDDDYFEEWVNDNYESAYIGGTTYYPYDILAEFGNFCDVIDRYQEEMNNDDRENAACELAGSNVGDEVDCQRYTIVVIEDDAGDYDGDGETALEQVRRFYNEQKELEEINSNIQKEVENDMMSLFQHIGA